MSLDAGGHLTHGARPNFSGKIYHAVQYGLDPETGLIDYDQVERLSHEHQPKMVVAGFSAYSRVVDWERFRAIADDVGAYLFVDMAHVAGLVATGAYPSPVPVADVVQCAVRLSDDVPTTKLFVVLGIGGHELALEVELDGDPGLNLGVEIDDRLADAVSDRPLTGETTGV